MEIEDEQINTGTDTILSVASSSTCFVCNDKLLDQDDYKLETKLLSVISQLFHLHLSSYQFNYLSSQEIVCIKCQQLLGSIIDLYTSLTKIEAEIYTNRSMVKNLISNAYLQNFTSTTTTPSTSGLTDNNQDEFIKQRVVLQEIILHYGVGNGNGTEESSIISNTTDKNRDLKIFQIDGQPEPEQNKTTFNLQQIISTQPAVTLSRMPILDQLIRKSKATLPYQQCPDTIFTPPAPKSKKRRSPNQQQQQLIGKKPPVVKKEAGYLDVFEGIEEAEEEELITSDLEDFDDWDFTDDNKDYDYDPSSSQQSPEPGATNYRAVKCLNRKKSKVRSPILSCPECPRTFNKSYQHKIHLESHKPMAERSTAHTCNICSMRFLEANRLQRHLKHVHNKNKRRPVPKSQCPTCGLQVLNLKSHLRIHEDAKPYVCSTCSKGFRAKKSLDVHVRIHSDSRPYPCKSCPASFRTSQALKRHAYIHSEERSFVCEHCGKSFRFKTSLTEHLHIHLQVKPHRCNVCGRRYKERGELEVHLRDDHTEEKMKERRPRPEWITSNKGGQGCSRIPGSISYCDAT